MTTALSAEQRRWVEQCVPRIAALARALSPRIPHASLDELESAGYEGLVQAALRYDPASGVPFHAFAHYRARGAMIDCARRAAPEIRRRSRALKALQATQALLEHAESQQLPPGAADPRTLRERVAAAEQLVAQTTTAVMLSKLAPADPELLAAGADVEGELAAEQTAARLRELVARCSEDEQKLIVALYVDGLNMHEYAEVCGKSVSTVSRHHAKLVARLGEELRAQLGASMR